MRTWFNGCRWGVALAVLVILFGSMAVAVAQPSPGAEGGPPEPEGEEKGGTPPRPPDREMGPQGFPNPPPDGHAPWGPKGPRPLGPPFRLREGGPKFPHGQAGPLPPEMEEKALIHLKETDPSKFEEVQRVRMEKPMVYFEILRDVIREREQLEKLKEHDPDEFKRRIRVGELKAKLMPMIKEYRALGEDAAKRKTELAEPIKKLLDEEFELRQTSREGRATKIEADLKRERERLAKRRQNKGTLIDTHFKDLVGENDGLKW